MSSRSWGEIVTHQLHPSSLSRHAYNCLLSDHVIMLYIYIIQYDARSGTSKGEVREMAQHLITVHVRDGETSIALRTRRNNV